MNEVELLRRLGAQARGEVDPVIEVVRPVTQRLRRRTIQPFDRRLAFISLCACSLAAFAVGAIVLSSRETDSVSAFSQLVTNSTGPDLLLRLVEHD